VLLDYLEAHGIPAILAATKADKLGYAERVRRARLLGEQMSEPVAALVVCSAVTGEGITRLWREIEGRCMRASDAER
jgi:GTP-binding protein